MCEPQWQPIETAPKDGTDVDLWGYVDYDKTDGRLTDCNFIDGKWFYFAGGLVEPVSAIGFTPTQWLPLPTPPKD